MTLGLPGRWGVWDIVAWRHAEEDDSGASITLLAGVGALLLMRSESASCWNGLCKG